MGGGLLSINLSSVLLKDSDLNRVYGEYSLDGNQVKILRFGKTKMNDMKFLGEYFTDHFSKTSTFGVKGDTLTLYYEEEIKAMEFVRDEVAK